MKIGLIAVNEMSSCDSLLFCRLKRSRKHPESCHVNKGQRKDKRENKHKVELETFEGDPPLNFDKYSDRFSYTKEDVEPTESKSCEMHTNVFGYRFSVGISKAVRKTFTFEL